MEPTAPDHAAFMRIALEEARRAGAGGEVPVGAVLVREGRILARGHNETITSRDPSAHAEIVVLRRAARAEGNHRLPGTVLFTTLEPCIMCFGAIVQGRVAELVYGAADPKMGGRDLFLEGCRRGRLHGELSIEAGMMADEAAGLLREFFRVRRS